MSFTQLINDLNIIQGLPTNPTQSEYTSAELQAKFDEAVNIVKTFLNATMIAELEATTNGSSGADQIGATIIGTGTAETVQGIMEEINDRIVTTSGDVTGPGSSTDGNIVQFDGTTGKEVKDGLGVTTTLATPGVDTNLPTEKAVRDAISDAGGGDFSTSTSSVTDGDIIIFEGTGGKTGKSSGKSVSDFLESLAGDTTPQLGGDLDTNGSVITHNTYDIGNSGSAKTINWLDGKYQKINLSEACTLTLTTPSKSGAILLRVTYAGTFDITWDSDIRWAGGTAPTLTKTSGRYDLISIVYDGVNISGGYNLNYTV